MTLKSIAVDIWAEAVGALALVSLALALLMSLGAWVRVIDAINQAAPLIFLVGLLIFALAFSVRKASPVVFALAGLSAGLMGARVVPELAAATVQQLPVSEAVGRQPSVRLVTFNMQSWSMNDPAPTIAWLEAIDADYIVLLETGGLAGQAVLRNLSSRFPYMVECGQAPCLSIILSKQPAQDRARPDSRWASASFAAPGGAGTMAIIGVHTAWPLDRPLNLLAPTASDQAGQYSRIADQVLQLGSNRTILAGDFNSGGWSFALNRMVAEAGLTRHSQALFSWPAYRIWGRFPPGPVVPIDHVMAGSDWALKSIKRGPALGSDHYPLVAELVWQGSGSIQSDVEAGR